MVCVPAPRRRLATECVHIWLKSLDLLFRRIGSLGEAIENQVPPYRAAMDTHYYGAGMRPRLAATSLR